MLMRTYDLQVEIGVNKDVVRFQVSMDDALSMDVLQSAHKLSSVELASTFS